ncbi:MAG: protein kinase [Chloroflexi bacterium]|nr:protein kinase [Chloroflexota bacterium]
MRAVDPLLGQQLGNFLIQQALGQGGMARVYKGLDVSLKRPVAVKVIGEGLRQSDLYAQRFEREAQAVAALHHPNIVNIFYFGNQDGLYYLVMEYIDGTDLESVLHNYAEHHELMPYADVVRILEAMASALDYAHQQGVIHRDVKPSNIMVERNGRPVLTDFGLALRVSEGTVGDTFGTPHYISPEQAQNSANAVPQSDLYSLGVVAYEMLAGTVPFDDPSPTALAMQHIMAAVPSPRLFNPKLSEAVERVLFKALAKEPDDRYANGVEFTAALRQSLEAMLRSPQAVSILPDSASNEEETVRHVSMQTVLDKVHQELAMQQAKGQTVTQAVDETAKASAQPSRISGLLPYIVAIGVTLVALLVIAVILSSSGNAPAAAASPTPLIAAVVSSPSPVPPTETTVPPTATNIPPSPTLPPPTDTAAPINVIIPPTETSFPPSATPIPPTETSLPPSATPIPPTETPLPPSATPIPPTETSIPPSATENLPNAVPIATDTPPGPTAAPSDWLPVRFIYNNDAFFWMNDSNRSIDSRPIVFERIGATGRFEGNRWAYWTMESGRCMEIAFADVRNPARPENCRPNAFFTPTRNQNTNFWTGSGQFHVLWNGTEIAVCEIAAGECSTSVPPA